MEQTLTQPTQRLPALDALRAVAVLAMVAGHTLDATLSDAARALPGMVVYWNFRTVTAPLFLAVAGWAVGGSLSRSGIAGWAVARRYLPRAALLFACGFTLRWPGWRLQGLFDGEPVVVEHFLSSDALHAVAGSLLLAIVIFALLRHRWARLVAVAAVAIGLPLLAPVVIPWLREVLPVFPGQLLVGRTSNFPLLPWVSYFFWGMLLREVIVALPRVRPAVISMLAGLAVTLLLTWISEQTGYGDRQVYFWRLSLMFLVAGVILAFPEALQRKLAPVGRASLWAYVLHLPIVYGWSLVHPIAIPGMSWYIGRSLTPAQALPLAAAMVVVMVPASLLAKRHLSPLKAKAWTWITTRRAPRDFPTPASLFSSEADARTRP